ncbi:MAG: hypothetical protein WDM92_05390 [Caulobacteraceae bacterium]
MLELNRNPGQLPRRGGAGGVLAGQHRAGDRAQPGQDAAVSASSPTATPTATASGPTPTSCR